MYNTTKHGQADYGSFGQLNLSQVAALTGQEGPDMDPRNPASKFYQLVYQVNAVPINLSGDVNVDGTITGYDHVNEAQVDAGHQLWVTDKSLLAQQTYSRIVQTDAFGNTYIAHAEPGSLSGDPDWRAQRIDSTGSRMWADNANFSQIAVELSGLSYTY